MKLEKLSRDLYGPARHPLKVLGQFAAKLSYRQSTATENVFVAEGLRNDLLGLPAIMSLKLVQKVETISRDQLVQEQFPTVFKGLGTIGGEYTIMLKEGASPHPLYIPRRVPFLL